MRKLLVKFGALALVVLLGYPVIHYRAVTPCGMYKRELTWYMERQMEQASAVARERMEAVGGDSGGEAAAEVEAAIEDVAAGIAVGVVEAKVRRMSARECAGELWRIKVKGQEP
jgi:hypothetical protein